MTTNLARRQNPLSNPQPKPDWAELTRLAGDRAAILFEELRRRLGRIEGLREELHYEGAEKGWAPRYLLDGAPLCVVRILPAAVEGTIPLDQERREQVLASKKISARLKAQVRGCPIQDGVGRVTVPLYDRATVAAFANLVVTKARLCSSPGTK